MADNVVLNSGSGGATLSTDEITRATVVQHVQYVKLMNGTDAAIDVIPGDATNGLDVDVTRVQGTVTVDGTGGSFPVTDSGGSLTVDNAALSVVGGGVEAAALRVTIANDSTGVVSIDDNAGSLTVDGSVSLAAAIPAGDNNIGNVDVVTLPNVTLAAGTNTNEVVGDAAHGAAAAGNPLLVGLEGRSTAPTAVDDGDVVRALASLLGKQVVLPYAIPANSQSYASPAAVTDTADDVAFAAVASIRHYITGVQVFNGHDTVGTEVVIKDGTTVLWRGWAEQTGGGCSAKFDPPLRGTANTAVNVANITTGSSTYFNLQGYQAAE